MLCKQLCLSPPFCFVFDVLRHSLSWNSGRPEAHYVYQAGLELNIDLPASASRSAGVKVCAAMPSCFCPSFIPCLSSAR